MDKIPQSSAPPKSVLPKTRNKYSKWVRVWMRFISAVARDMVKRYIASPESKIIGKKIDPSSIRHSTLLDFDHNELNAFLEANDYEKRGKFIKAEWLRAKASEKIVAPSEKQVQQFRELGRGFEGRADLVFRGTDGPLEVKKTLHNCSGDFKAEIALLKRLDHPNIVKILSNENTDTAKEGTYLMENGGVSLAQLVPKTEDSALLPKSLFVSIAKQMANVLCYLREERVLHRDIKPRNIVIDQKRHITLIDFGMAHDRQTNTSCDPHNRGTEAYMEPDALGTKVKLSDTCDMFAAGHTLFNLLTGRHITFPDFYHKQGLQPGDKDANWDAYKKDLNATKVVMSRIVRTLEGQPQTYIDQVTDLITRMLEPDPKLRITPEELKNHPLLSDPKAQV